MTSVRRAWTVTPHEPIEKLEDNLWTVQSLVPGARFPRRMCIVRRIDGTLAYRMLFVGDRAAVKAALSGWSELPGLERIVPCHGEIVGEGAGRSLARAAATL